MKKFLLFISFNSFLFSANAQIDILFPDSNARWSVFEYDGFGNPSGHVNYYFTNADTVINSQVYNQLFVFNQSTWFSPPSGYHGAIRKDVSLNKVFIVPEDSVNEYLLYDFSAAAGDTIYNVYTEMDFIDPMLVKVLVYVSDSIQVNSVWLKRIRHWALNSTNQIYGPGDTWIETIGAEGGLLTGVSPGTLSSTAYLDCMSYRDTSLFPVYGISSCWFLMESEEISNVADFSIVPNPSDGIFTIQSDSEINRVKIYNCLGEIIFSQQINSKTGSIDLSSLNNGVYFISNDNDSLTTKRKIIKADR